MSARTVRLLALPLSASLGVLALTGVPSQGAVPTAGSTTVVQGADGHGVAARHKKKKKHHHQAVRNKKLGIPRPTAVAGPGVNQASVTWPRTKGANRYSVLWSAGPYGNWPGPVHYIGGRKWLPGSARSATLDVSGLSDYQLALPFGNPAFLDLMADNSRDKAPRHKAKYVAVWPQIATPAAGVHLRVGQYNLSSGGRSAAAEQVNIASQSLSIAAVEETANGTQNAAPSGWTYTGVGDEGIIFNPAVVSCRGASAIAPHAVMSFCSAGGRGFWFVSAHFTGSNADTGAAAQDVAGKIPAGTAIVAGDFTSNREPYGSNNQAQPVLVRNGFWDSQASLGRVGVNYSTFNGFSNQRANPSGQGTRADYIMTRGIQGSFQYHNVVGGGGNPSDHNLIWAELAIP